MSPTTSRAGALVPLLERFNPGDLEQANAVYVGGQAPRRVRAFIDYMVETVGASPRIRYRPPSLAWADGRF
jgi:DNA-binding transcriptional LysR family regulator